MEHGLKEIEWRLTYYTSDVTESGKLVDILHDFYLPALNLATRYDRVAGYFRSSSLAAASQGYTAFLRHGGKMRLIVGADLQVQDVAAAIGNAVETMLQNGGLAQTDEEMQMACAKLITWMNDHEEETRRLFPRYTTEEARAQLVAPRAVANLIQTQKQVDRVLHQLGAESLEALLEQMEVLKARNMPQTGPLGELELMADASEYADEEAFTQRCRQIGEAGEAAALQWLARQAMEQGAVITHQSEREIQLERNGIHIRFYRADSNSYHQAGYDIVRTEEQPDGTVLLQTYYEVKSTTRTDQMYRFQLSPMQMQTAIQMGDAYRILRLFLSKDSLELRNVVMVTNLLRQLMGQSVLPVDDPVTFRMMQCPYDL